VFFVGEGGSKGKRGSHLDSVDDEKKGNNPVDIVPFNSSEEEDLDAWSDGYLEWVRRNFKRKSD